MEDTMLSANSSKSGKAPGVLRLGGWADRLIIHRLSASGCSYSADDEISTEAKRVTAQQTASVSIKAAWTAIFAAILYQLLLITLIFLRPDLDPTWHTISEWVIGPYGWLMRMVFFLWAVSYTALFVAVRRQVNGKLGKTGLVLLFVCIIGTYGVGTFTTDPLDGSKTTITGLLHTTFGTAGLMLLPFAALLVTRSLARRSDASRSARCILRWTAWLPLLGWTSFVLYTALFIVPLGPHAFGPGVNIGIPPRITILTYAAWTVIVALQTMKLYSEPSQNCTEHSKQYENETKAIFTPCEPNKVE